MASMFYVWRPNKISGYHKCEWSGVPNDPPPYWHVAVCGSETLLSRCLAICWSQGGQQERLTRKESSEWPNDMPTHCETQKNTVEAKTAPTHLYGEMQYKIQQRQIWGKSKSMINATQVSQVSTTLLSRTATPTKRPARAPQKWPIYLAHYIKT